jgi:pimeloyl-ACP methyl ester carboxylesterase
MSTQYLEKGDYKLFTKYISSVETNSKKPVLVFLHDSWGSVEMWGDFPETIVGITGMNALVYDRRGYGKSSPFALKQRSKVYLHDEANELIEVMNASGIQNAVIYGHSDGATIALIAAALYPDRIKGLVLEGPHSFIEESGKDAVKATRERAKETNLLTSLEKFHGDKTEELFRLWHETWLSDYFADWTIVPLLKSITCHVLAFQGENDEFGSIDQLNILKKEIPTQVTISEIANAGHTPRKEAEVKTRNIIADWFKINFSG